MAAASGHRIHLRRTGDDPVAVTAALTGTALLIDAWFIP
jgi:hypothetical protein